MNKDILSFEEAAELLKTSKPTLYRWIRDGRLRCFKAGREWRFYRRDLDSFLESSDVGREVIKSELRRAIAFYEERLKKKSVDRES